MLAKILDNTEFLCRRKIILQSTVSNPAMKMKRTQVGLHFISITIASIAKGWKSTIWEDFKNCSIQTVCYDEIKSCQGEVKWGNLKEKLSATQILFVKNKCIASEDRSRNIPNNSNHVNSRRRLQIIIICTTVIICAIVIAVSSVVFTIRKTKGKRKEKDDHTWEVERKDVTLGEELGQGNFGTVYKGALRQVTCHNYREFDLLSIL